MRIAVKVTIEMTPEQIKELAAEYGFGTWEDGECKVTATEVRDFVKGYIGESAQQQAASEFWEATVS